jgi:hypothetical protein
MMNTTSRYPSKRPSVKQVSEWDLIYSDYHYNDWRGEAYSGQIEIYNGYPFPDFYKVVWKPTNGKKVQKLFYGEVAHFDVARYAGDLGFQRAYEEIL